MTTRTAITEQDRQSAACAADTGPARRGRAVAPLTQLTEPVMHMAPQDNRPTAQLDNRAARRWTVITLILTAAGAAAWFVAEFRDLNARHAAASAIHDCKQRAAAAGTDLSDCDKAVAAANAEGDQP